MIDNLVWLSERRDYHATLRDAAYAENDWALGNQHNEQSESYYACIQEIVAARERIKVFQEVIIQRIILAHREQADEKA
jgi:hypothetical protein